MTPHQRKADQGKTGGSLWFHWLDRTQAPLAPRHAGRVVVGGAALALANPIASDLSDMRPSLLPGLIAAAQANASRTKRIASVMQARRFTPPTAARTWVASVR